MSINDEIGDLSGGQAHLWNSERRWAIVDSFTFDTERSNIELDCDVSKLTPEARASEIARNLFAGKYLEFGSDSRKLAVNRSRLIIERALTQDRNEKTIIGYFGGADDIVPATVELGYLANAFDAGATQGDLIAWGVDPFTVIQLIWWQRRDGETLLAQQIRAIRNGWALPWLAGAVRDQYGNLTRMVDRGKVPEQWIEKFASELAEVREVLEFFRDQSRADEQKVEAPRPLSDELKQQWAQAFAARAVTEILPDVRGRWAALPKQGLEAGQLREPLHTVVRYLDAQGFKPADWGNSLTAEFFGRIEDK
jgi:hypothetical protein